MTDTGRFPERGQLDQTGGQPNQLDPPAAPMPPAYPFPEAAADTDDEDLLMPGAHAPWSDAAPPAVPSAPQQHPGTPPAGTPAASHPAAGDPAAAPGQPAASAAYQQPPAAEHGFPGEHPAAPHPHTPPHGVYAPPAEPTGYPAADGQPAPGQAELDPYGAHHVPPGGAVPAQPAAWQQPEAATPQSPPAAPAAPQPAAPDTDTPSGAVPPVAADREPDPRPAEPPAAAPEPPPATPEPPVSAAATPPEANLPQQQSAPGGPASQPVAVPGPREESGPTPAAVEAAAADPAAATESAPDTPAPPPTTAGYPESEREAVHRLMRDRPDTPQSFTGDPIPHEVLLRVLEAAHTAPTVGHAQPWDFVIIRSPETRQTVYELATRQRESYAKSLTRARAKQLPEAAAEPILDAPVNIVVTSDPTRGGQPVHSADTRPEAAPYSTALAVENLWLAARAEGLGVGWVGFHDERELVKALNLPEHLDVVAYLCVGYAGQSPTTGTAPATRRPLSWVVHDESYGRRALPGAEPHDLLGETLTQIRPLDAQALGEAWERQRRMTKPTGALGALEVISAQLCGLTRSCPPLVPEPAALAVFAGDHGVHAQGVSRWSAESTGHMVANFLGGGAVANAFAAQVGAEVCVIDVGVRGELPATPGLMPRKIRPGTGDFTTGPALSREDVLRALEVGIETARDLVAAGNRALLTGEIGAANTTVSAALTAAFTGSDPAEVTGRGSGIDDDVFHRKIAVVRTALELHRPDPADPVAVLAAVGGLEHAALTGLILGGAALRVPVLLDGITGCAAALAARAFAPEAVSACIAGHRGAEPGHIAGLTALGLRPLVDLDLRLGEGTGALLALPLVQSAARSLREVATFEAAGLADPN